LHANNPAYVWRRIRLIALEEVSIADLTLVAQVLAIAGKSVLIRKLGAAAVLMRLVELLASAPKCRTACDLLVWLTQGASASHISQDEHVQPRLERIRFEAQAWMSVIPQSRRTRQGWRCVNRGSSAARDALLDEAGVPPLVRFIVQRGSSTDALNALLVPAFALAQQQFDAPTQHMVRSVSLEAIGDLPAYAYCLYSEPGRAALRQFVASDPLWGELRAAGVSNPATALGHLVFYEEGGFCAMRRSVLLGTDIERVSEQATLVRCGIPSHHIHALKEGARDALPRLNVVRHQIAASRADRDCNR
jgi:hypothetical protein